MNKAQPDSIKIKNFCAAGLEVRENLNSHSLFSPAHDRVLVLQCCKPCTPLPRRHLHL